MLGYLTIGANDLAQSARFYDAILLPLGVLLVVRMIPADVMAEHRATAQAAATRPQSLAGATAIIAIWIALSAGASWLVYRWLFP